MFPDLPMWLDYILTAIVYVSGMTLVLVACVLMAVVVAVIATIPFTLWDICFGEGREARRLHRNIREQSVSRNADRSSS